MGNNSLDVGVMQEALDAYSLYQSEAKAALHLGIPRPTLQSRLLVAKRLKLTPTAGIDAHGSPKALVARVKQLETELKAKDKQEGDLDIIKGIVGKLARSVEELDPPLFLLSTRTSSGGPGVPTLFASDWHTGEVVHPSQINGVNKYNISIFRTRVQLLIDSAVRLLKILSPQMNYPGIVFPLGGDMISGNIHEELTATNEINSMPAVLELYGVLVGIISRLADIFGAVFIPCVTGNHGRDTQKIWAKDRHHTSFDWLLYRFLAKHFEKDKRVTFLIPDGPDAYYKVYNHRYLLTHGDQFRGGDGMIGALGPIIRGDHKKRSRNAQIDMEYDTLVMGHWHQDIFLRRLIVNGSLKGYDEYAYRNNFGFEPPSQQLWVTHPKYGITYRMPVLVDRQKTPVSSEWVSVQEAA